MLSDAEREAVKLCAGRGIRLSDGLRRAVADDWRVVAAVLHILARQVDGKATNVSRLADALGVPRETIRRLIVKEAERGLVEMGHRGVAVREERLRAVADAVLHHLSLAGEVAKEG